MQSINKKVGDLAIRYSDNATLRGLVQLIPFGIGGAGDTFIATKVDEIKLNRARIFFDELASGKTPITDELIESEDFLHCFFATSKAALRNRRQEKIRMFARLLKSAIGINSPRDIDEFEEMLSILEEMTHTEWCALLLLNTYSGMPRTEGENDLQWSTKFWDKFRNDVETKLNIAPAEFTSFMN